MHAFPPAPEMRRSGWIERMIACSPWRLFAASLLATIAIRATGLLTAAMYLAALTAATGRPSYDELAASCLVFVLLAVFCLPLTAAEVAAGGSATHLLLAVLGL